MWWDFEIGQYEIPKGSKKTEVCLLQHCGLAVLTAQGQLKLATQRFRQVGIDYLNLTVGGDNPASVTRDERYDKIFSISRAEVDEFWHISKSIGLSYLPNSRIY